MTDWQKREKLKAMPPVVVDSRSFGDPSDAAAIRAAAEVFWDKNLQGKFVATPHFVRRVRLVKTSFREMLKHSGDTSTLRILAGLIEALNNSIWLWKEPDDKGRKNVVALHYVACKVNLDGQEGYALLRIREQDDFHLYFDGDFTDAVIMEKGDLAQTTPSNTGGTLNRLSRNKLYQWWHKVKPEDGHGPGAIAAALIFGFLFGFKFKPKRTP